MLVGVPIKLYRLYHFYHRKMTHATTDVPKSIWTGYEYILLLIILVQIKSRLFKKSAGDDKAINSHTELGGLIKTSRALQEN